MSKNSVDMKISQYRPTDLSQHAIVEEVLQLFIAIVDAELFEAVQRKEFCNENEIRRRLSRSEECAA